MSQDLVRVALDGHRERDPHGNEYWLARKLQLILGYADWRNFFEVIEKARAACVALDIDPSNQFVETTKLVVVGSGTTMEVPDFFLSRYAAYLVAMNGDSRKPQIAVAQSYFAVQTIRQEQTDQLTDSEKRIQARARVKDANKKLNSAAKNAGVINYAIFHDAGYRGLYDMPLAEVRRKKGIGPKDDLLDVAGRVELAANEFRITQTEQRLQVERTKGQEDASHVHNEVGKKVRKAMRDIGGTMPEELPIETPIKKLTAKRKKREIT
jgi:DNA-damage-inducible protein D